MWEFVYCVKWLGDAAENKPPPPGRTHLDIPRVSVCLKVCKLSLFSFFLPLDRWTKAWMNIGKEWDIGERGHYFRGSAASP